MNVKILLFPTDQIKQAISQLYAHVLKFMIRAMKWYAEGKVKHFIVAVFLPASLRFKDLLDNIESCAQTVDQLAVGASQAEQRSMHVLLQEIRRTMTGNILGAEIRICVKERQKIKRQTLDYFSTPEDEPAKYNSPKFLRSRLPHLYRLPKRNFGIANS
jgi:hypothetical protein